jgi:beta-lactamase regulating signal transducer with metallopeptidase domain
MNNLGITLVGVAIQVTLVALVAAALYGVMARRGPEAGSLTARLGLVGIVALTFAAFVPLPRWWNWSAGRERAAPVDFAASEVTAEPMLDVEKKTTAAETPHESGGGSGWSLAGLRGLLARLSRDKEAAPEKSWSGPWFVAVLFLVGLTLCLLRLLWALWAVRGFLQRGFRIDDPALNDLAAALGAEMGSPGPVELRECPDLAGAATVGWRRPVVLLPSDWRGWSEQERRTVLAHELAHVRQRDYAAGLVARLALALHFYHPLAHWLAGRLRLQQELAADTLGARFAGGRKSYLAALAGLALRQDGRTIGWPARTFLSSGGTLMRRLQMLRAKDGVQERSMPYVGRAFLAALLAAVAVGASALRNPAQKAGDNDAGQAGVGVNSDAGLAGSIVLNERNFDLSQPPMSVEDPFSGNAWRGGGQEFRADSVPGTQLQRNKNGPHEPFDLSYLPADSQGVFAIRPAAVLDRPDMKQYVEPVNQYLKMAFAEMGLKVPVFVCVEEIEQAVGRAYVQTNEKEKHQSALLFTIVMVRTTKDVDWKKLFDDTLGKVDEVPFAGKTYCKIAELNVPPALKPLLGKPGEGAFYFYQPDARTLVIDNEKNLKGLLSRKKNERPKFAWDEDWKHVERDLLAHAFNTSDKGWLHNRRQPEETMTASEVSLVENSTSIVFGADWTDRLVLQGFVRGETGKAAEKLEQAIKEVVAKQRKELKEESDKEPPQGAALVLHRFTMGLLDGSRTAREGTCATWRAEAKGSLTDLIKTLTAEESKP